MTRVVGVHFRNNGRMYYFDPSTLDIHEGDGVIVETARGTEFAEVCLGITEVDDDSVVQPLAPVMRIATAQDKQDREANMAKEPAAYEIAQQKIAQHQLDMKLVSVEYAFNGAKIVFYFTADERVDFRDLVKDLASQFHTRIELRQIGVRDEAKLLGGLGPCGRPICCKEFLDDFRPVSIKMAKEQNLSLSPTKISGLCGRLMCCLQYEQSCYEEMKHLMPKAGKEIQTPDGNGIVMENNAITEKSRVKLIQEDGSYDFRWYHYSELAKPGEPAPTRREVPAGEADGQADAVSTENEFGQAYAAQRRANNGRRPMTARVKPQREAAPASTEAADPATAKEEELEAIAAKMENQDRSTAPRNNRRRRPSGGQQKRPADQQSASGNDQSSEATPSGDPTRRPSHRRRHRSGGSGRNGGGSNGGTGNGSGSTPTDSAPTGSAE